MNTSTQSNHPARIGLDTVLLRRKSAQSAGDLARFPNPHPIQKPVFASPFWISIKSVLGILLLWSSPVLASQYYEYTIVAQSYPSGAAETFSSLGEYPSIADDGTVAFFGKKNDGLEGVYVGNGPANLRNITAGNTVGATIFGHAVQINNRHEAVTYSGVATFGSRIHVWDTRAVLSPRLVARGGIATEDTFGDVFQYPSINDNHQVVFSARPKNLSTLVLATTNMSGGYYTATFSAFSDLRPVMDNLGRTTVRAAAAAPATSVRLYTTNLVILSSIATSALGFTNLAQSPGVTDDGGVVAFVGNRGNGFGLFINFIGLSGNRITLNIAGENAIPKSELGQLDINTPLFFSNFDLTNRVAVKSIAPRSTNSENAEVLVSFIAAPNLAATDVQVGDQRLDFSAARGIWTIRGFLQRSGNELVFVRDRVFPVIQVGEPLLSGGFLPVDNLAIYDPLATITDSQSSLKSHYVAFWASSGGTQTIVRSISKLPFRVLDAARQFAGVTNYPVINTPPNQLNLLTNSAIRFGATADGATKLLLHFEANAPGRVYFSEANGLPGGILSRVDSGSPPTEVSTIDTSQFPDLPVPSKHVSFALYTVPESIDSNETTHIVTFTADYTPDDNNLQSISEQTTLDLVRPPVLLVHGTWSDPGTWSDNITGTRQKLLNAEFKIRSVDWESLNAKNYAAKRDIFWRDINDLREEYHGSLVAFTRADVVAHSQGGNIVRLFAQDPRFHSGENFYEGYFRRFIPMAVPHLGTEFANFTHDVLATSPLPWSLVIKSLAAARGKNLGDGAVEDLEVGSCANRAIGNTLIPSHIVADECSTSSCDPELFVYLNLLKFASPPDFRSSLNGITLGSFQTTVFHGRSNDFVVAVESQLGGLEGNSSFVSFFPNLEHTEMPADSGIADKVVTLLKGPTNTFALKLEAVQTIYDRTGYDIGFETCPPRVTIPLQSHGPTKDSSSPTPPIISITYPVEGAVFTSGGTLSITADATNATEIGAVLILVGSGNGFLGSAVLESPPFSTNFSLPVNFIGDLPISVFVRGTNEGISIDPLVRHVRVTTSAQIQSMRVVPDTLSFTSQGSGSQLAVYGQFSDGVERNIGGTALGVLFQSSNPLIAAVTTNGFVTAGTNGDATITISSGAVTKIVNVRVRLGVPYVLSITPSALLSPGMSVPFQITGWNLGGILNISFLLNATNDPSFSVSNFVVNADGTILTGTLTAVSNAVFGLRTIVVTTLGGSSTSTAMPGNLFANNPFIALRNLSVTVLDVTHTRARLEIIGPAILDVALQVSTNLTDWVSVRTNTGGFQYIETNSTLRSTRFFRAVTAP